MTYFLLIVSGMNNDLVNFGGSEFFLYFSPMVDLGHKGLLYSRGSWKVRSTMGIIN